MGAMICEWWLQWAFGIASAALIWFIRVLWLRQKATELGIQALLRDRIVVAYYHYNERGYISLHGLENVNLMYEQYHNLGGNGTVTKLVEDMRKLEVKED